MKATPGQCPEVQRQLSCNRGVYVNVRLSFLEHLPFPFYEDTCATTRLPFSTICWRDLSGQIKRVYFILSLIFSFQRNSTRKTSRQIQESSQKSIFIVFSVLINLLHWTKKVRKHPLMFGFCQMIWIYRSHGHLSVPVADVRDVNITRFSCIWGNF